MKNIKLSIKIVISLLCVLCLSIILSSCSSINNSVKKNSKIEAKIKTTIESSLLTDAEKTLNIPTFTNPSTNFVDMSTPFLKNHVEGKIKEILISKNLTTSETYDSDILQVISYPVSFINTTNVEWNSRILFNSDNYFVNSDLIFTSNLQFQNAPTTNLSQLSFFPRFSQHEITNGFSDVYITVMSGDGYLLSNGQMPANNVTNNQGQTVTGAYQFTLNGKDYAIDPTCFYAINNSGQQDSTIPSIPFSDTISNNSFVCSNFPGTNDLPSGYYSLKIKYGSNNVSLSNYVFSEYSFNFSYTKTSSYHSIVPNYNILTQPTGNYIASTDIENVTNLNVFQWEGKDTKKFNDEDLINYLNKGDITSGAKILYHSLWNTYLNLAYCFFDNGIPITRMSLVTSGISSYHKGHIKSKDMFVNGQWNMFYKINTTTITIYYNEATTNTEAIYFQDIIKSNKDFQYTGASNNSGTDLISLLGNNFSSALQSTPTSNYLNVNLPFNYIGTINKEGKNDRANDKNIFEIKRSGDCQTKIAITSINYLILIPMRDESAIFSPEKGDWEYNYPANNNLYV